MYGVKGGKGEREYPTTKKVMRKFYELHPPANEPSPLDVTDVGETSFR